MTALPLATAFTDSAVTEGDFKSAITDQRDYLSGLFGSDGTVATALATLGSLGADTVAKTANYTVLTSDRGKVILCSGTFTLSLTAAATLADGFNFAVINTGSGVITIDPNSTEQIDGAGTKAIQAGGWAVVTCTGSAFWTMGTVPTSGSLIGFQVFTSSGTYTKATNNPSFVIVEAVGAGGGGGTTGSTAGNAGGGGGGGGYVLKRILASALASSETVTIGAGSTGTGGTTSFGSICSATGGAAGQTGTSTALGATGGAGGIGVNGDYNGNGGTGQTSKPATTAGAANSGSGGCSRFMGNGVSRANSGNGFNAPANSGGGGSGGVSAGAIAATGGNGGSGLLIVWEYK